MIYQHVGTAGPNMVVNDNVFLKTSVSKKAGQASDDLRPRPKASATKRLMNSLDRHARDHHDSAGKMEMNSRFS